MTTADHQSLTRFTVHAAAEPQAMPRVLEVFALRSLVPHRWHARRTDEGLRIDVEVGGLAASEAAYLARRIDQMVLVERVLMRLGAAEKGAARERLARAARRAPSRSRPWA